MRMTVGILVSATVLIGFGVGWSAGCASSFDGNGLFGDAGSSGEGGSHGTGSSSCPACLSDSDCTGGDICAQFQGDIFCAPSCANGLACPVGRTCMSESAYNGSQVSVCVPDDDACGQAPTPGSDGGRTPPGCDSGSSTMCGTMVGPSMSATCHSCSSSSSSCQPNGCYGGWWCDTSTDHCESPPTSCASSPCTSPGEGNDSGSGPAPVTGTVTGSGGSLSALRFAVVGDTRPPDEDDTSGYPTSIIQKIFQDIQAASPAIPFSVATGDYQYANPSGSQSSPQLSLYMAARATYTGVAFPGMGNHECTGYTTSNCGSGNSDGETANYENFLSMMLAPIGQSKPYYSININSTTGAWTSKFVFIAANAWDSAQSSWLASTLAVATTYTFVIRHEASEANTAPGVSPSDSIISRYPLTLEINGHTHTYEWSGTNKVIVGNGGAPITGGVDYGYAVIQQQTNGNITIDMIDYESGAADSSFHRELTPTGAEAS
jgi:hypothetical protein